jgi:hypothetical protein
LVLGLPFRLLISDLADGGTFVILLSCGRLYCLLTACSAVLWKAVSVALLTACSAVLWKAVLVALLTDYSAAFLKIALAVLMALYFPCISRLDGLLTGVAGL